MLRTPASTTRRRPPSATKRLPATARTPAPRRSARPISRPATTHPTHRPLILLIVIALCGAGLFTRLVFWQVMQHGRLLRLAQAQQASMFSLPALRGRIYDASSNLLAAEATQDLVFAEPRQIKDPARTANLLAPLLQLNAADLRRNLTDGATYLPLAARVSDAVSGRIARLRLPGIFLSPQPVRMYPEGSTAAQVVGYVDANGTGQYGLERQYNALLAGKVGLRRILKDTSGARAAIGRGPVTPSLNGADLRLSINGMIQSAAESQLNAAVKLHRADGGTIIVMDPRTGYILALANSPSYDPNQYARYADQGKTSLFMNPAIQAVYEPGSTFKIITMAAGLDTGAITPSTSFYDTGVWTVDGVALHNWNNQANGPETMTQVLQRSANVGASFVASRLTAPRFYRYARRFGIGRLTGVDLPGEVPGTLWQPGDKAWTEVSLYTNSFGQGLDTTPLQMIRAVGAVANGGMLMKPQIVRSITYRGRVVQTHPVRQGRVISRRTARTLTGMLVRSAIGGEAKLGLVKGYNIAAKTGTANVAGPNGGYIQGDTIASIVGYAPANNPRYIVLVKIDRPRDTPWGSMAAAPVLRNLFQELFMLGRVAPSPRALYR